MQHAGSKKSLRVRPPAVAGLFYPGGATQLAQSVDGLLSQVQTQSQGRPRALICPHAGYQYSGVVAATAFAQLCGRDVQHVLLMGPSHRVAFRGVALADVDVFETPLGKVQLSDDSSLLAHSKLFVRSNEPHEQEHCLEVELPFLQRILTDFTLTPLVFGEVDERAVAEALESWLKPATLLLASSDLSHYRQYDEAVALDLDTIDHLLQLDAESLGPQAACGRGPVSALLYLARWNQWKARLLAYQNSGDTAGDRNRVVGYAAIGFYEA
jgi:MEMO1 family protein